MKLLLSALFLLPHGGDDRAPQAPKDAVLVLAHGGDEAWNEGVRKALDPLRERWPVAVAFGMGRADTIQAAFDELEKEGVERVAVVRLFLSASSFEDRILWILGRSDTPPPPDPHAVGSHGTPSEAAASCHGPEGSGPPPRARTSAQILLAPDSLLDAPEVGAILAERARALVKEASRESVLILAHGVGDEVENARWIAKLEVHAEAVRRAFPFRAVRVEALREDWPDKRVAAEDRIRSFVAGASSEGGRCLVLPARVYGFGPYAEVLEGLEYVADRRGLLPHDSIARWVELAAWRVLDVRNPIQNGGPPVGRGVDDDPRRTPIRAPSSPSPR
jgi:sirohydrochlorin ferrochelatase